MKIVAGIDKELGSIDHGKIADFVVLKDNTVKNIDNLRKIEYVIKEGAIVYGLS